ncbi:hypothetical protein, partial [uncultured Subdoligranulum sp.]|uniref:hypothetical protein n=1 Tax=uncultured Subdoligranulum sp. TaxID=512298 RepID=UPI0025D2243A
KSRNRPMASYTICRKISLYVLPASAHVRRWQRIFNLFRQAETGRFAGLFLCPGGDFIPCPFSRAGFML